MIKYVFKDEGPVTIKNLKIADVQAIGEELSRIEQKHDGRLTPDDVVKAAADEKSPLHPHFEWNDSVAAHQFRLDQARMIIRTVRIVDNSEPAKLSRAWLSVTDRGGVSYRSVSEIMKSRHLQLEVYKRAEIDLEAWMKRYREITEIVELVRVASLRLKAERDLIERDPGSGGSDGGDENRPQA